MNNTESNFCQIVGWGSAVESSRRVVVAIYEPRFCNMNFPQAFCSPIDWASQKACSASQGAPVICGGNTEVSGVLVSTGACDGVWDQRRLHYLSVGEFREWIEEVSGAEKFAKLSSLLILSAMLISLKSFL